MHSIVVLVNRATALRSHMRGPGDDEQDNSGAGISAKFARDLCAREFYALAKRACVPAFSLSIKLFRNPKEQNRTT